MLPEEIVQKQLDAYNARDINTFVACHAHNAQLYSFSYSKLIHRIVLGNKVIDHEEITGRKGIEILEFIAIYEVDDTSIIKAYFMRK